MRQIFLSWLYFFASTTKDGSITPPSRLPIKCSVEPAGMLVTENHIERRALAQQTVCAIRVQPGMQHQTTSK